MTARRVGRWRVHTRPDGTFDHATPRTGLIAWTLADWHRADPQTVSAWLKTNPQQEVETCAAG